MNKTKKPANEVLQEFLQEKGIDFAVRKREVRHLEDGGILIEAPVITVVYKKDIQQSKVSVKE